MKTYNTITKEADVELTEILGKEGRIYKDGILEDLELQSIRLSTTSDELALMLFEKSYYRSGFRVVDEKIVEIPCFFSIIEGDVDEFVFELNSFMRNNRNSIIIQNGFNMLERENDFFTRTVENLVVDGKLNYEVAMKIPELSYLKEQKRKNYIAAVNKLIDWCDMEIGEKIDDIDKFIDAMVFQNKRIIDLYHDSNYQKTPSKYVIICSSKSEPKSIAIHRLLLMHILAIDIIVINKKGYSGITNHLDNKYYDEFMITKSNLKPTASEVNYSKVKKNLVVYAIIAIILLYIIKKMF